MRFYEPGRAAEGGGGCTPPTLSRPLLSGEIDLAGRLRAVKQLGQRLAEVAQTGFCECVIVPRASDGQTKSIDCRVLGIESIRH